MDLDKNKGTLPSANLAPWAVDTTFGPGFSYSPRDRTDDSDFFSMSGTQAAWSALEAYSQAPVSAPLQTSIPYFTGDGLVGQDPWTLETDSDSGDISPVGGRYPAPELDAAPRWSWSQPSNPPFDMDNTSASLPAVVANYALEASSPATNGAVSTRAKANNAKTTPKLRTASRKTRKSPARRSSRGATSPSEADTNAAEDITPEDLRARRNHNLVEKQYRNRLNAQFERLLAVLPSEQQRQSSSGYGGDGFGGGGDGDDDEGPAAGVVDDKRMSKAEVLDVATRRIKDLESERRRLQRERRELLQNMEMMSDAVSRSNAQR
ncbi:hypothetical protein QBC47DRAFT_189728 [Echria macrotheca]|uniref:BHLH domain-containing protein n=1 Tax=Echria macrotheca TaxID=438768 RepID=A0AAJ0FBS6_9PEZI|nr:hypothetical protein QBC47DRAFT_189728 [Echria macrotheca]